MPNYHPVKPPSLHEPGMLKKRFKALGIDYKSFGKFITDEQPQAAIRRAFRKPDGTMYARSTVKGWIDAYKAQQKV